MDGVPGVVAERHGDLAAAGRQPDRSAARRLNPFELAVDAALDTGDVRPLPAAAQVGGVGGEQLFVEGVEDGVAPVDDGAERRQALADRLGRGGRRNVARRANHPPHQRRPVSGAELVDAAEQRREGDGIDDRAVSQAAHGRLEEGAVRMPRAGGDSDHAPLLAARLVEVEHGQVGEQLVGGEHLVPAVLEVGGQSRVDGCGLLLAPLMGVEEVGPGQGEPRLQGCEAALGEGHVGHALVARRLIDASSSGSSVTHVVASTGTRSVSARRSPPRCTSA